MHLRTPFRSPLVALVLSAAAGFVLASCGGGTPGEQIRPKDQTFAGAMGETSSGSCHEPESGAEPLVVDWKPEQRGDLEVLMKDGVAVVSYSCKGFKLLKDCKVDGKYGFLGMSKKEQVVKLTNADEVKANLPLAGAGIAANIGAEMQRGATLDVALIMIGKVKTTWGKVAADELTGECDGATHFVKGATVGAFVMETGAKGEAKTAAQLFGAGASGGSSSTKNVRNQDGDLSDCAKAQPDSPKAPAQCQAIVRLELKAILPKAAKTEAPPTEKAAPPPDPKAAEVATPQTSCPKGLVFADGKCTEPSSAPAFQCKPSDATECLDQCGKGHAGSCGAAGALLASGGGGASKDEAKARELLGKGCDGGDVGSCTNLGLILMKGRGGAKDAAGAVKRFEKACGEADALGCGLLGAAYESGDGVSKDEKQAVTFLQKGCEGGHEASCGVVGKMLFDGRGATKDVAKATDFLKRACDGGQARSCVDLGDLYDGASKDVPKNPILAKMLYQRGCFRGEAKGCTGQGRLELGQGGSQDSAKRAFEMACMRFDDLGCAAQKVLFGGTRPVVPKPAEMMELQKACMSGSMRDCAAAGTLQVAAGQKAIATASLDRACIAGDPLACAVKKK
ncbi:MAG: sel1 repeat family protein [Labilithrix sp.]|nr:sel1 repeat family protein [Labilithrix sp.]